MDTPGRIRRCPIAKNVEMTPGSEQQGESVALQWDYPTPAGSNGRAGAGKVAERGFRSNDDDLATEFLQRIDSLKFWRRGEKRAPHKPLLLLLALGEFQRGNDSISFADCKDRLTDLLREFGPNCPRYHPEYPFWHLQSDKICNAHLASSRKYWRDGSSPSAKALLDAQTAGGFPEPLVHVLRASPHLIAEAAQRLLERHFPETLHPDILAAVGLEIGRQSSSRKARDPRFRERILVAYQYACAVCDLDIRIGNTTVGLEAAHIQWHQAGGPDIEPNGLALCTLHHKLFDLGAFTLENRHMLVSEHAHGGRQFEESLLRYHGRPIKSPIRDEHAPAHRYSDWHSREVFKPASRPYVGS